MRVFSFTVGYADYPRVQALADRSPALRIERTAFGDGVTVFASAREEALPAVQTARATPLGGRISFADGGRATPRCKEKRRRRFALKRNGFFLKSDLCF